MENFSSRTGGIFHTVEKIGQSFSIAWKKSGKFFHCVEKSPKLFPYCGKIGRAFFNTRGAVCPFFHTVENILSRIGGFFHTVEKYLQDTRRYRLGSWFARLAGVGLLVSAFDQEDFLRILAAPKPTGIFSALARRDRPLADTSPARVVRNAPSSENPPLILARQPRQNPQEILRMHVLRTADKARQGLFTITPPHDGAGC